MATAKKPVAQSISDDERRWRAQSDVRTLKEAEEIRKDKSRMTAAQREAQTQLQAIAQIAKAEPKDTKPKSTGTKNESMNDFVKRRNQGK